MLLTDWKVNSLKMARRMVNWYGLRWGIECWHQVLKDVCRVETRQMKTARALERALALDMVVAWRAQFLCRLGKQSPNLPASLYYSRQELEVLQLHRERLPQRVRAVKLDPVPESLCHPEEASKKKTQPAPEPDNSSSTLSLFQANLLTAMLAGFWGRKSDGHPGPKTMARGLELLAAQVEIFVWLSPQRGSKRPRQPD